MRNKNTKSKFKDFKRATKIKSKRWRWSTVSLGTRSIKWIISSKALKAERRISSRKLMNLRGVLKKQQIINIFKEKKHSPPGKHGPDRLFRLSSRNELFLHCRQPIRCVNLQKFTLKLHHGKLWLITSKYQQRWHLDTASGSDRNEKAIVNNLKSSHPAHHRFWTTT